jgi:hypothetical protein
VSTVLDSYLAQVDPAATEQLRALDRAITAAHAGFDTAIKYRMVMYALDGDWRHWVCGIHATRTGVCLRFLYGVLLDDDRGVLRPGSANLKTWDVAAAEPIDEDAVRAYVAQAVALYPQFRAHAKEINAAAKAAADGTTKPRRATGSPG